MRSRVDVALAILLCLAAAFDASAQITTADLVGTVRDTSGSVVPGVSVTATNEATGVSRSTTTSESGTYSFT